MTSVKIHTIKGCSILSILRWFCISTRVEPRHYSLQNLEVTLLTSVGRLKNLSAC